MCIRQLGGKAIRCFFFPIGFVEVRQTQARASLLTSYDQGNPSL